MLEIGTPEAIGIAAVAVAAFQFAGKFADKLLTKKNGNGNGSAGGQTKEFWQIEFREMESRIRQDVKSEVKETEGRLMKRLDDLYQAMQTLVRWKGGD